MKTKGEFAIWLEKQFFLWQAREGRGSRGDFAAWLGVSRNTLNNWMLRGHTPTDENVVLLAAKLGLGVYDALGIPRPDPDLQLIIANWGKLPPEVRQRLAREAEQIIAREQ